MLHFESMLVRVAHLSRSAATVARHASGERLLRLSRPGIHHATCRTCSRKNQTPSRRNDRCSPSSILHRGLVGAQCAGPPPNNRMQSNPAIAVESYSYFCCAGSLIRSVLRARSPCYRIGNTTHVGSSIYKPAMERWLFLPAADCPVRFQYLAACHLHLNPCCIEWRSAHCLPRTRRTLRFRQRLEPFGSRLFVRLHIVIGFARRA